MGVCVGGRGGEEGRTLKHFELGCPARIGLLAPYSFMYEISTNLNIAIQQNRKDVEADVETISLGLYCNFSYP